MVIIKQAKQYEVDVYECIFNENKYEVDECWREFYHGLKKFVPKYFGS